MAKDPYADTDIFKALGGSTATAKAPVEPAEAKGAGIVEAMSAPEPQKVPKAAKSMERDFSDIMADAVANLKTALGGLGKANFRASKNVAAGAIGSVASAGGLIEAAGAKTKIPAIKGFGQKVSELADGVQKDLTPPDPGFMDALAQGAGSSATFLIPGIGVEMGAARVATTLPRLAKWLGIAASSALEASAEAGGVYRETLARTKDEKTALTAANKVFWENVGLLTVTNRFGMQAPGATSTLGKAARAVGSAASEGAQEMAQEVISLVNGDPDKAAELIGNFSLHDPELAKILQSGAVGAAIGGGGAILTNAVDLAEVAEEQGSPPPRTPPPPPPPPAAPHAAAPGDAPPTIQLTPDNNFPAPPAQEVPATPGALPPAAPAPQAGAVPLPPQKPPEVLSAEDFFDPDTLDKIMEANKGLWDDAVEGMALRSMQQLQNLPQPWDESKMAEAVARAYSAPDPDPKFKDWVPTQHTAADVYETPIMKDVLDQVIKWGREAAVNRALGTTAPPAAAPALPQEPVSAAPEAPAAQAAPEAPIAAGGAIEDAYVGGVKTGSSGLEGASEAQRQSEHLAQPAGVGQSPESPGASSAFPSDVGSLPKSITDNAGNFKTLFGAEPLEHPTAEILRSELTKAVAAGKAPEQAKAERIELLAETMGPLTEGAAEAVAWPESLRRNLLKSFTRDLERYVMLHNEAPPAESLAAHEILRKSLEPQQQAPAAPDLGPAQDPGVADEVVVDGPAPAAAPIPESYFPEVSQAGAPIGPAATKASVGRMHEAVQGPVRAKLEAAREELEARGKDQKPGAIDPEGLAALIIRKGGISSGKSPENAGELAPFTKKECGIDGLAHSNPNRGMSMSRALEVAIEEGFLERGSTENDLLDAIDQELTRSRRRGEAPKGAPTLAERLDAKFNIPRRKLARLLREVLDGGGTSVEADQVRAAALEEVEAQARTNIDAMVRAAEPGDLAELPQGQLELWRDLMAEDIKTLHAATGKEDLPDKAMEKLWELERAAKAAAGGRIQSSFGRGDGDFDMPFGGTFRRVEGGGEFHLPDGYKPLDTALRKPPKVIDKGPKPGPASFKRDINKATGVTKPEAVKKTTESKLLRIQLASEARGARIGAMEARRQTRAELTTRFKEEAARQAEESRKALLEAEGRADWQKAESDLVLDIELGRQTAESKKKAEVLAGLKKDVADYARKNLPIEERGHLLQAAVNAKTPRDVFRAFQRIDERAEVLARKRIVAHIKKRAVRALASSKVAADFQERIKEALGVVQLHRRTAKTLHKMSKLAEYIGKATAEGLDLNIPANLLNQLRGLGATPLEQLSMAELEQLAWQVEMLEELGRLKVKTRRNLYLNEKAAVTAELVAGSKPIESHPQIQAKFGDRLGTLQKIQNAVNMARDFAWQRYRSLSPMPVIFDLIDGSAGYVGANMHHFFNRFDGNWGRYLRDVDADVEPVRDMARKLKLDERNFERISVYAYRVQPLGAEYLIDAGYAVEEINALELTKDEKRLYDAMRNTIEANYPRLKTEVRVLKNETLGKVPNYFPVQVDYSKMTDMEVWARVLDDFGGPQRQTAQSFTKQRKGGAQRIRMNALDVFERHISNVHYFLNNQADLNLMNDVVRSPEYKAAAGDMGTLLAAQWLTTIAKHGGDKEGAKVHLINVLRRHVGAAQLGFRPVSALVQFTSLADGAALLGGGWTARGTVAYTTDPAMRRMLRENLPEFKHRIGDDAAYGELSTIQPLAKLEKAGYAPMQAADGITAGSVAAGAYLKSLKSRGLEFDAANPDAEALRYANAIMSRSQNSTWFGYAPGAIARGEFTGNRSIDRAVFQFQSFMLNRWSLIEHDAFKLGILGGNAKEGAMKLFWINNGLMAETMGRTVAAGLYASGIAALTGTAKEAIQRDDDEFWEKYGRNMMTSIPFAGQLLSAAMYRSTPIPVLDAFMDAAFGVNDAAVAKKSLTRARAMTRMMGAIGSLAGIPGTKEVENIVRKVLADKTIPFKYRSEISALEDARQQDPRSLSSAQIVRLDRLQRARLAHTRLNADFKDAMKRGDQVAVERTMVRMRENLKGL